MKIVVIDKGSGYIICLSIEHGLGNEGMYCVTEGADAKAGDTDKGSRHNFIIYLSIEHGFWKRNICTVSPRVGVRNSGHRQGQWTYYTFLYDAN